MAPEARAAAAAATGWWWWWWIAAPELVLLSQRIEDMLVVVVAVVVVVLVLVFRFYSMERKPFRVPSPKLSPAHTAVRLQKKKRKRKEKKGLAVPDWLARCPIRAPLACGTSAANRLTSPSTAQSTRSVS